MCNYVYNNPKSMFISVIFRDTIIIFCFTNPTNIYYIHIFNYI